MCAYVTYSYYESILFWFYKPIGVGEKLNYTTVPNYNVWSISAVCVTLAAVNIYMSLS